MSESASSKNPPHQNVVVRSRRPAAIAPAPELPEPEPAPKTAAGGAGEPPEPPYEVGYGRPPRKHQFRKGKSGNPRGRPRGAKGFKGELRKVLTEPIAVKINGRTQYKSRQAIICLTLADKAARGDMRAVKLLIELDPIAHEMLAKNASAAVEDVLSAEDDAMVLEYLRSIKDGAEETEGEP